jgi:putative ATP-binding cassette transporter
MGKLASFRKKSAEVWQLIAPYWRSEERYKAWAMLAVIIALNLAFVYISVQLNEWNAKFYNSIQQLDQATFIAQCYKFVFLVTIIVAIFVSNSFLTSLLGFHWRKWLTKYYLHRWMDQAMFYRLSLQGNKTDNPDQRISQDLAGFCTGALSITLSLFKEIVNLSSFVVILWTISGSIQIPLPNEGSLTVPGYMVWLALIYAALGTLGVYKIGKPLVRLDFNQEKFEANFRYQLVRLREHSEEVALYQGEEPESLNFSQAFGSVYNNFRQIIYRGLYVNAWQNFYNNLSTIFPFLIAAPRFFSGALTLGILMQIASAFSRVESSLSLIVLNFQSIASLFATTNRLLGFSAALKGVESVIKYPKVPSIQLIPNK